MIINGFTLPTKVEMQKARYAMKKFNNNNNVFIEILEKKNYLKNVASTIGLSDGNHYLSIDEIDLMTNREIRKAYKKTFRNLGEMDFKRLYEEMEEEGAEF